MIGGPYNAAAIASWMTPEGGNSGRLLHGSSLKPNHSSSNGPLMKTVSSPDVANACFSIVRCCQRERSSAIGKRDHDRERQELGR